MIATSAAVMERLQGADRETHWRLLIEDADGTMRDYSDQGGVDWRSSAEWGKTVDAVVADGVVELAREAGGTSLAPMVEGSTLNRNSASAYAPAIDMGRALEIWVQVTAVGDPPVEADWVLVYDAIIQKVDWSKTLKLSTLDRSSLLNKIIRTEKVYGSSAGTAVETVMQQVIDDNLGVGVFTMQVPVSPGFMVTEYPHGDGTLVGKTVRQALDDLSAAFAGYVDYRSDLTLIVPNRTEPTEASAVATIGPEHYKAIPRLDVDLDAIRNVVRVTFRNSATGAIEFVEATHAGSITAYGEHFIGITEGDTSPIDTTTEAQDMANAIRDDLAVQRVQQQVQDWFFYPVELGDHITWKANGKHYDTDQHWAVTGYRHRLSQNARETTFDVRGAASGGYRRWIRRAGGGAGVGELPEEQDIAFKSGTMSLFGTDAIADIVLQVIDPAGASGTLSLWTNKLSTVDPDPTTVADQTLTVAAGQTVGPAAALPDVTATALDDVLVMSITRPGARKMIYARWDSADGRTTGIKGFPLARGLLTLDEVDPTIYVGNVPKRVRKTGVTVDADAIIDRVNDTLDVVPEGTTYQKVKASALTTGEVDLSKAGVRNKTAQYILYSDGTAVETLKPAEAGAQKNPPFLTGVGIGALDVATGVDVTAKWTTSGTVTDAGHNVEIEYWHDNGGTGSGFTAIATATEASPVTNKSKTVNHAAGTGDDLYKVVVKLVDSSGNVIDEKSSRWEIVAL